MKKTIAIATICLLLAGLALAHGKEQHIKGTVSKLSANEITVKAVDGTETTVAVSGETKFTKNGAPATANDLKVGNRVVIHASKEGGKLTAETVKFGKVTTTTTAHQHDEAPSSPKH